MARRIFRLTKREFLDLNIWDNAHHFHSFVESMVCVDEVHIDNRDGMYEIDTPLWAATKFPHFYDNQFNEYYVPMTLARRPNSAILDFHPGGFRMAVLFTQPDWLVLTLIIHDNTLAEFFEPYEISPSKIQPSNFIEQVHHRVGWCLTEHRQSLLEYRDTFHVKMTHNDLWVNSKEVARKVDGVWKPVIYNIPIDIENYYG